jgi:hypothetical protein
MILRAHGHSGGVRDKVHDTDPDEPRGPSFARGCLLAFALALLGWAGLIAFFRWLFAEAP